jgi:hypothetical protein
MSWDDEDDDFGPPPPLPPRLLKSTTVELDDRPSYLPELAYFPQVAKPPEPVPPTFDASVRPINKLPTGTYVVAGFSWNFDAFDPLAKLYFELLRLKGRSKTRMPASDSSETCKLVDAYIKEHELSFLPHELFLEAFQTLVCHVSKGGSNFLAPHTMSCRNGGTQGKYLTDGFMVLPATHMQGIGPNTYAVFREVPREEHKWFRFLYALRPDQVRKYNQYEAHVDEAYNDYNKGEDVYGRSGIRTLWLDRTQHRSDTYGLYGPHVHYLVPEDVDLSGTRRDVATPEAEELQVQRENRRETLRRMVMSRRQVFGRI